MSDLIDNIIFDRKSVKWLHDLYIAKLLEVDNSYQRRFVWTRGNQIQLIETILLSYPIPEIYLLERGTNPENGETLYSIIDGQQRLTSIFEFIANEYSLQKKYLKEQANDYVDKTFSELNSNDRSNLWKYPFVVRIVKEKISKDETIEMFLRLNRTSTTLNPQELRHAEFGGLFLRLAEELANLNFWEKRNLFSGTDLRRMGDVQFVSQILIFFRFGFEEDTTQTAINRAYDTFNDNYEQLNDDRHLFINVVVNIDHLMEHYNIEKFLKGKVHLYTLFNYVYYLVTNITDNFEEKLFNYGDFATNYTDENVLMEMYKNKYYLVEEYKALALEGTQKRKNRINRFKVIKELMSNDS